MNKKDKQLLITTALDATWETARPFTLLGRWCLPKADSPDESECHIAKYHWDDRRLLISDYHRLKGFYEELLLDMSHSMNQIHGVERSARYWRILLGPWLGCFLQIAYDRWLSIENIAKDQSEYETTLIDFNADNMIPTNMSRFAVMRNDDKWNHYLYGTIIKEFPEISVNEQDDHRGIGVIEEYSSVLTLDKKNLMLKWLEKVLSPFVKDNDSLFIATYLPFWKLIKLQLSLRQFPVFRCAREVSVSYAPDKRKRNWQLRSLSNKELVPPRFERWLRKIIPSQIPTIYLEGYKSQLEKIGSTHWPYSPKVIWTSVLYQEHDFFKLYVAEKTELGAKLIIGQHGGHYGMAEWNSSEDHQVAISDVYLSWGWSDASKPNIIPVGQLKQLPVVDRDRSVNNKVMLVTMELPRYSYYMMSVVVGGQWLDYLQDQYKFVDALSSKIKDKVVVRLKYGAGAWQTKLGWNAQKRWDQQFPGICIDPGRGKFYREIMKYDLVVSTYNAATYLESMAMNIPTIIFWDPKYWELREDAVKHMEDLESVGIFHTTPESAAKHLESIWDDILGWWELSSVQNAKNKFCREYSALPDGMMRNIKDIINGLA